MRAVISREHGPVAVHVCGESFSVRAWLYNFPTPVASASALLPVAPPTPLLLTLVFPVHTPPPSPLHPSVPVPPLPQPSPDRQRPGGERLRGRQGGRGSYMGGISRLLNFFFSPLSFLPSQGGRQWGGVFGRWRPLLRGKC